MTTGLKILAISSVALAATALFYAIYTLSGNKSAKVNSNSRFLFIGDSTTANTNGFVEKFSKQYPNAIVKKIALVGAKSDWMLDQLKQELTSNKYDVVTILAGSNDIFATLSIANLEANLQQMYNLAKANGAKVIAITPPNKSFYPATTLQHKMLINYFTTWLKNNKSVDQVIDLENLVADQNLFASDNQHINNSGHDILEKEFSKKVIA